MDYNATNGVVTFKPGDTRTNVIVQVIGNRIKQPDRTFFLNLGAATNAVVTRAQATGTIVDDDAPPLISISDVAQAEGNSGTTPFVFNVTLSDLSGQIVTVDYLTVDGTATAGSDYEGTNGTLTFAPGVTNQTITIFVNGERLYEPDEFFLVNLTNSTHAAILRGSGLGTILNDDLLPTVLVGNPAPVPEGNSGNTTVPVAVGLSAPSAQTVTVKYATADGSATAGSDYQAAGGTLAFPPGVTNQTITLLVVGNTLNEPDKTFLLKFLSVTNGVLAVPQVVVTILNDDPPPALQINDVSLAEGNSGTTNANFVVALSAASGQIVTVDYTTTDGTATAGSDYQPAKGTLVFAPGETNKLISVAVIGDLVNEPDETWHRGRR